VILIPKLEKLVGLILFPFLLLFLFLLLDLKNGRLLLAEWGGRLGRRPALGEVAGRP
jgi:hypothetical protein